MASKLQTSLTTGSAMLAVFQIGISTCGQLYLVDQIHWVQVLAASERTSPNARGRIQFLNRQRNHTRRSQNRQPRQLHLSQRATLALLLTRAPHHPPRRRPQRLSRKVMPALLSTQALHLPPHHQPLYPQALQALALLRHLALLPVHVQMKNVQDRNVHRTLSYRASATKECSPLTSTLSLLSRIKQMPRLFRSKRPAVRNGPKPAITIVRS